MARIKYYNTKTGKWEYADSCFPGGNVELDTTLTQEGKAADAKAVGDAISKLSGGNVDVTFEGETMIISTANNAVKIDGETLIL